MGENDVCSKSVGCTPCNGCYFSMIKRSNFLQKHSMSWLQIKKTAISHFVISMPPIQTHVNVIVI